MIPRQSPADQIDAPLRRRRESASAGARLLRTETLTASDRDAWLRLAERSAEPNPYFRPEFVLPAVAARDDNTVLLVVEQRDGWDACLPLRWARRWRRLPLPCLAPWLPEYAYLNTPLVDRDRVDLAAAAMADFIAGHRRAAMVVLDRFDPCGTVGTALTGALAVRGLAPLVYADFQRAVLRRRPELTYLEESLSSRRRKELRRLRRVLSQEVGDAIATVDRSDDPGAWRAFLQLEGDSWKGDLGTALASRGGDAEFFLRMCAGMQASGKLQVLALETGGQAVAMQCNLIERDIMFGFKVAYDRRWARFSPGVLLEVDAIETFHNRTTAKAFDSCAAPDNDLLNRLWPDRRRLQTVLVPTGAPLAALVRPAVRAGTGARSLSRRSAGRLRRAP